ncbi:MAG: STAS domain-containing protein [Desulfovibrionaceae bacterium]|jgi:anti-anti-sigma factor|nr:STAS domain-containing protein [Desulfovibrionaceae bacterium]
MDIQSQKHGNCLVLRVNADSIDYTTCDEFKNAALGTLKTKDFSVLLINLKDVGFMDSMTIGAMVGIKNALTEAGKRLAITNVHPYVRKIISVVTLNAIFDLHETQADALKELCSE